MQIVPSLDVIKARLESAKKANQPLTPEEEQDGWTRCPVCEGEGDIEMKSWHYDNLAAGIQVFGIGKDLEALEDFAKHAPSDIQFLLDYIDMLTAKR